MGFFDRFKKRDNDNLEQGLEKTRTSFLGKLNTMIRGKDKVDEEVLDELEGILVTSDVGVKTTIEIIQKIEERVARDKYVNTADLNGIIRSEVANLLLGSSANRPAEFGAPLPNKHM